jgi:PAS domain S-box-containing protein
LNTYREDGFGRRRLLRCAIAGLAAVCFSVSASALDPTRTVSQYLNDSWGTERGWPGGSITAIAQSSDGYLWIGTDKGLVRFDGLNFHQFQLAHPDPIWIGPVRTLVVDASDNLWVLLQSTLVFRYHDGNFELIRGETENGTTTMARGTSGAVLLSSLAEGTLTYVDNRFRSLSSADLLTDAARVVNSEAPDQRATPFSWFDRLAAPTSVVISMAQTDDGKIWLGTEHQGLFYLQEGRVSSASSASNGRVDTKINCLLPLQNSELWVGTAKGVLRWSGTKLTLAGVPSSLLNLDVLSILRDRDSNIWVGTSRGLFRYNANGISLLSTTGPVAALFEDREGNIWIGSTRGLERLRDSAFVTYSLPNLKSQSMGPLHVDSGGRTWIAPIQGGLRWLKEGKTGVVNADGIANDVVYSIAGSGPDDVWLGRQQGGLTHLRYSGNSFSAKTYTQADGLAQNRVYAVYRGRDGTVWSGTLSNGVSELKNGHFTNYTTADGLAANTISSIAEGPDGTMWFGTPKGVSAMSQKGWRTYTANDGLPSDDVNCLLQDSTRTLWIGTAQGLAYLSDGQVHVPREVPESLHAPIFGVVADKNGWLWIATSDRVLRIPRDKLLSGVLKAADVREYDQADGLESTEGVKRSRSVVSDSAGRISFSLSSGLSVVNASRVTDNSVPALPHIEAITADNNTVDLASSVQIPPSPRRITFEYTGLSLAAPGRIRFRYFLENFDRSWSQPVAAREAVYTNLGPGSYRFRLVASNSEGLWNGPEIAIVLNVAPAYYQTVWFRSLCVFLFLAVLTGFYRIRLRNLERQRDALRKSEKELRDVIDTIPAMVWSTLPDGSNTYVNKRFVEYTGSSAEQTAGSGWHALIHPDDLERHASKWTEAVATGKPHESEVRSRRSDGRYRWQLDRGVPLLDEDGKIVKWYGVTTDIEDRKRAEESLQLVSDDLQDSKAKLEEAQRIAHVGYWSWDLTSNRVIWSDETYRIYGLQPQEYPIDIGVLQKMIHPKDLEFVFRVAEEAVRGGLRTDVEHRIICPSGEVRTVHSLGDLKKDASGRPIQMFGTVQDITDRKRAGQRLRESEAYLAEAQKLSQTGSWAWNPATGDIRYWSEMCYCLLGFDPAGPLPRFEEFFHRIHPDDQAATRERFEKAIRDKADFELDYRVVHPEKGIRDIHVVGHAVLDGSNILEFVGTVIDVTERKRAEETLQQSQLYLNEGQRLAHMGSWAFDPSGFFEYWSQELFKIYGLDPQQGAPTLEQYLATVHPADRAFMAETISKMNAERSGCDVRKRIVRPDGELRYIRCVGIPVVEGEVLKGFLGTAIDITAQELLTQELERRQAHLTQAQELTHTGSWAWRLADRKTVHLSEEFYRIYGFDPAAGAPTWEEYFERVHSEDRLKWKATIEEAILEKADYDQEFRILLPNGMVKWIHTVGHPVLSDAGDLEQFVGSSTDITEHKSAEQEREKLRQLEADLAHIDRVSTLGEMAASLAHEIKQPIAAAITSANSCIEWLSHEPPNLDRARAAAARIDKYGNRAADIIDRIRSFYKKSPPQRELVDVNGIIDEMLTLLTGEATRSSIAMRTNLSAELPKIMVDRVQMQQVFMNLMLNGIEAMEDSGGDLTVKSQLQDGQLQFSVSDTGVGLPTEMDQIFSAFFTTKPQGSGMGLAISRSIVESHGGQLWASANSGGGATFHFTLPSLPE